MVCEQFNVFDVVEEQGWQCDVVYQDHPPGDEDAVTGDAGANNAHCTSYHG